MPDHRKKGQKFPKGPANPPKKKQATPKATSAPADSPTRKAALLIRAIPANRPGHPGRDISKISDLDLVKKFRLWAVYNELPVITFSPEGDANWSNVPTGPTKTTFLPPLKTSTNDTHHVLVVTELPWTNIGGGQKGAPKHCDWTLALPLSPWPADAKPRVGIYINKKLLPNAGLTVNPTTFNSPNAIHASLTAHGKRINIVGVYRPPSEDSVMNPSHILQKLKNWEVPLQDTIILGDFNVHHSSWDALANNEVKGCHFHDWATDEGLSLHNDVTKPTFYPTDHTKKPAVLDLTLTNPGLNFNWTTQWELDGSIGQPNDHVATLLTIHPRFKENSTNKPPKTYKKGALDWTKFRKNLKECLDPYRHLLNKEEFSRAAAVLTANIEIALTLAEGPTSNRSNPLPFWNAELTLLHRDKELLARKY
ncbi:hypothetical protein BOTBODRAFT_182202 [Botryobasidium botryosum FD-172 SS1]|uniref:Endonuclease/exonuclease/phosphatase domain-containing protein n=1 Tax=Botryobasidium botryosum (strain FD-172 SS1) TaxID=930990 RepID=A0A067LS48_BOTB1|nr:hypothetical protein BOTBODRAFT_182202 [Botryobasidium botryosum FD-172 SS1]